MRIIKRYANRKLYDTETSKPITLPEIAMLIAEGEHVQVVDRETGEDITTMVLAQIIVEQEKEKRQWLPIPAILREMIRRRRDEVVDLYEHSLLSQVEGPEEVEEMIRELVRRRRLGRREGRRLRERLVERLQERKGRLSRQIEAVIRRVLGQMGLPSRREIEELKERVRQLQARIEELLAARPDSLKT
ncbi:MAG TPA: hypothetical protein EYP61_08510 [Candidatus Latescibacteria bacterium]|nr:hypothetical protein [Candidatus Latescibacterota bacterium]